MRRARSGLWGRLSFACRLEFGRPGLQGLPTSDLAYTLPPLDFLPTLRHNILPRAYSRLLRLGTLLSALIEERQWFLASV